MSVTRLEWLLRVAVAGAFVGHGAYGAVVAKSSWFSYFGAVGIPQTVVSANALLAVVGAAEIAAGLVTLLLPIPALLFSMAGWKIFTELLRPIAGEPGWEFVERASNMVAPLALALVIRQRARWTQERSELSGSSSGTRAPPTRSATARPTAGDS